MGDFVKGAVDPALPPGYRRGILHHRRVDAYAQSADACRRSRHRLDARFGHYRGIMVDIFYDHFLACNWSSFSPVPLVEFTRAVYAFLERDFARLPPGLQRITPSMIRHDWLSSYKDPETIGTVLARVAVRLRRPNPLADGLAELHRHYTGLEEDFCSFLPAAAAYLRTAPRTGEIKGNGRGGG